VSTVATVFLEQRTYTLVPGGATRYLQIYSEVGRDAQERIIGKPLACYTREFGELNQLIFIWPLVSLAERHLQREALGADVEFRRFREQIRPLLLKQENSILREVS
jgi:hypothetical protein